MIAIDLSLAVKKALADLATSSSQFTEAVQSTGRTYPAPVVSAWHGDLFPSASASGIGVGERYTPDMIKRAAVWIDDTDAPVGQQPLGNFAGWSNGQRMLGGIVEATATVYVYHQADELCTVLWTALQARLLLMVRGLMDAGYRSFDYTGGGALGALELASNGWLNVAVRTLGYRAMLQRQLVDRVNSILDRDLSVLPLAAEGPNSIEGAVIAATVEG